jgi:hypothetical protein
MVIITMKEKSMKKQSCMRVRPLRTFLALALATLGAFTVFGPNVKAHAEPIVDHYRLRGPAAYGSLDAYDDCVYTDFYVSANAYWEKNEPGAPTSNNAVYAGFYQSRFCGGDTWGYAYGSGFVSDVAQLDPKLASASASVSFDVFVYECTLTDEDYSCTETVVPFTGTINWTGVGTTTRTKSNESYKTPSTMYRSHYSGTYREAEVSGSATLDGVPVDFSQSYGSLRSINSGTMSVSRY